MLIKRPITSGLSPNTQIDDLILAIKLLLSPWKYFRRESISSLEQWFRNYFSVSHAISFNSGRSGLFAILRSVGIKKGDEVLIQAFTCVVVATPIIAVGAKPIYLDIDDTLTIDPKDIEKKITKYTKAIVVQHTFGIPADMDLIMKIAQKYKLFVIEDMAHTIGGMYKNKKLGTFGNASFFSFGRDKAFSCVFGGMVVTNDVQIGKTLRQYQHAQAHSGFWWTVQQLWYPIITSFVLQFYYTFFIGKGTHFLLRRLNFFSFPVYKEERQGKFWYIGVKKLSNPLAALALHQVKKLEKYNKTRKEIGNMYRNSCKKLSIEMASLEAIPVLRFPILVDDPKQMKMFFQTQGIYIGDWFSNIVDPKGSQFKNIFYEMGICPKAEQIAKKIVNLPVLPTMTSHEANKVVSTLESYAIYRRNN